MAATNQAVYTEAQCQTMMDDTNLNPTTNEERAEVHITLNFRGVTANPATIFDALQTLGTVQADKVPTGKRYEFIIS